MAASTQSVDFQRLFEALPNQFVVVDPGRIIVAATDSFLAATLKERSKIVGRDILDVFPDNPNDPTADGTKVLRASIERVLVTREIDVLHPQRYDMELADGSFEVRYWQPLNAPVFGPDGEILYVLHGAEDVTAQVVAAQG